jgi:hypothetical protein
MAEATPAHEDYPEDGSWSWVATSDDHHWWPGQSLEEVKQHAENYEASQAAKAASI